MKNLKVLLRFPYQHTIQILLHCIFVSPYIKYIKFVTITYTLRTCTFFITLQRIYKCELTNKQVNKSVSVYKREAVNYFNSSEEFP